MVVSSEFTSSFPMCGRSPPMLKMLYRPVAVADFEPVRGGNRCCDVSLGLLRRSLEIETVGEARRDRRRQRAAGPMQVRGCDTLRRKPHDVALPDQEIEAFIAAAV